MIVMRCNSVHPTGPHSPHRIEDQQWVRANLQEWGPEYLRLSPPSVRSTLGSTEPKPFVRHVSAPTRWCVCFDAATCDCGLSNLFRERITNVVELVERAVRDPVGGEPSELELLEEGSLAQQLEQALSTEAAEADEDF